MFACFIGRVVALFLDFEFAAALGQAKQEGTGVLSYLLFNQVVRDESANGFAISVS